MQRITGVDSRIRLVMTLVNGNVFCSNSTNYVLSNYPEVILAIYNSKLINYFFKLTSTNTNVTGSDLSIIPIIKANESQQQKIESLVNQILTQKEADTNADTSALEAEIDVLVYKLYGLTYEEVLVVDEGFEMSEGEYEEVRI